MENNGPLSGVVFNIQRFTVHDGPGIRTEVFLKGCTLRCRWCSNPESLNSYQEVGVYTAKCIGTAHCGRCLTACPTGSLVTDENGFVQGIRRDTCIRCLQCAGACPSSTLKIWGALMTSDQVLEEVLADRALMERSGGGVTFSGGEPLVQHQFLLALLKKCKANGLHTCVETALHIPREHLEKILPFTDLFIFDIKEISDVKHMEFTGAGNGRVLENAKYLAGTATPFVIRIPYVPGYTGARENILGIRDFILHEMEHKPAQLQFLRFRQLGEEKYRSLGLPYQMEELTDRKALEKEIHEMVKVMTGAGIPAVAGSTKKINLTG